MFTKERCGAANAIVAGWGNLGGGTTQLIVGSISFPLLKTAFGNNPELA
jgi:NNP family nitrate/nitrite transporter-like MFS transporter